MQVGAEARGPHSGMVWPPGAHRATLRLRSVSPERTGCCRRTWVMEMGGPARPPAQASSAGAEGSSGRSRAHHTTVLASWPVSASEAVIRGLADQGGRPLSELPGPGHSRPPSREPTLNGTGRAHSPPLPAPTSCFDGHVPAAASLSAWGDLCIRPHGPRACRPLLWSRGH